MTSFEGNEISGRSRPSVIEVELKNAYDASEYANLENYMRKFPGVQGVHLDRTRGVAHLTYDSSVTTAEAIESALRGCGYKCECLATLCSAAFGQQTLYLFQREAQILCLLNELQAQNVLRREQSKATR